MLNFRITRYVPEIMETYEVEYVSINILNIYKDRVNIKLVLCSEELFLKTFSSTKV